MCIRDSYWGITLDAPYHRLKYTFEVIGKDGTSVVYGDRAISDDIKDAINEDGSYFKIPYCHEIDMVKTPDWVKNTVWYQIFPERCLLYTSLGKDPLNRVIHPEQEDLSGGQKQRLVIARALSVSYTHLDVYKRQS